MNYSRIQDECINRLNTLKEQGLLTDIDVVELFRKGELCVSEGVMLFGEKTGLILPVSSRPSYKKVLEDELSYLFESSCTPYFVISQQTSFGRLLSVFYVSHDEDEWDDERHMLEERRPLAIVYNFEEDYDEVGQIEYEMFSGGPIRTV